ncbi:MAG TPA: hypothetical protein PKA07_14555, partial [Micropruina sp.]|nr:hypothetical protein [Micropruina sp.]
MIATIGIAGCRWSRGSSFLGISIPVMYVQPAMEFFDALVRYEVALWSAVDRELVRRGQVGLGQLHALRLLERHRGLARVQDLSDDIGITVGA